MGSTNVPVCNPTKKSTKIEKKILTIFCPPVVGDPHLFWGPQHGTGIEFQKSPGFWRKGLHKLQTAPPHATVTLLL